MIVVTGGAGFIGSNIVAGLNARGRKDIIVVDCMSDGQKMQNLADLDILDYWDQDDFLERIRADQAFGPIEAVFHQGACSDTTEWDGRYIMRNNYEYSKDLLNWCQRNSYQFIGASSASVYGRGENGFREMRVAERPINMYAYSKFQFDQYVRASASAFKSQVVCLRYFNVYGPRETHKGVMASTAFHFNNQILKTGACRLFAGSDGYGDGEQRRDFVYVDDCVAINLWFWENPLKSGIFNVGTGRARSFNDVAGAVLNWHRNLRGIEAKIEYFPMPDGLKGFYQNYTQADITALRQAGYKGEFHDVDEGVKKYLDRVNSGELAACSIK